MLKSTLFWVEVVLTIYLLIVSLPLIVATSLWIMYIERGKFNYDNISNKAWWMISL